MTETGYPTGPEDRDERIIGVALRRSALALVLVAVVVAVVTVVVNRKPAEAIKAKTIVAPAPLESGSEARPEIPWTDVTEASGIDFVHENGARGDRLLPETMGSGVAVLDFDGDGDSDLLFVNGRSWPWDRPDAPRSTLRLYANDGTGRFHDVTGPSGLDVALVGMGVAVGDVDGDGDPDLFVTAVGPNRLFRNEGGRFIDVTDAAGVAGDDADWSTSAGFFDADNDGDLDLFVANYVRWSRELDFEVGFTLNGADRAYGPPRSFAGRHPSLFRNDGTGRFTDVSASAGIEIENPATGQPMAKALGIALVDLGRDGLTDVFVANDTVQNLLFRNRGNLEFEEVGAETGVAFDSFGLATGAMGVDVADIRGDGALAFAIGNFSNEMSSLYVQQHDSWLFADESAVEGIGSPSRLALSFGMVFLDADLDGRPDLIQANGHLEEAISEVQASQHYRQPAQFFWNAGPDARQCFVPVPTGELGGLGTPIVGRAAAAGDLDGDGDPDVVLTQNGGRPLVVRNDQDTGHHWLRVRLEGVTANRDGIGAELELEVDGRTLRRRVMPTRSYLSQVEPMVTFGLGTATAIDRLRVIWPGGQVQEVAPPEIDRMVVVRQE